MPELFEIGVLAVVMTLWLGGWLMVRWSRQQTRRDVAKRRREEILDTMTRAGEQALKRDPVTCLEGLRALGTLRDDRVLDPVDDEYIVEVANVVISTRLDGISDEDSLVLGTTADSNDDDSHTVLPHEQFAATLAVDIANAQGQAPSALVSRIVDASATAGESAETEPAPLRRSA